MSIFLTNIKLNHNQLIDAVAQKLSTAPQSPVSGQIYYNTTSNRLFVYNGSEWIGADSIGATMTGEDIVTAINGQGTKISIAKINLTVVDNLTSTSATSVLSANQGKVLNDKFPTTLQEAKDYTDTRSSVALTQVQSLIDTSEQSLKNYADGKIAELVDSSPTALDTLKELATALGNDPNFATTMTTELGKRTKRFKQAIGNETLTTIEVTHNLGTRDVIVGLRETDAPYARVICDVEMTTDNKITLKFAKAPTANQYTVTVIG